MLRGIAKLMCTLSVLAWTPITASAHSLADALAYAYENSDLLDQQRYLLRAQDEDVAVAVSALRPSLTYFAQIDQSEVGGTPRSEVFIATPTLPPQITRIPGNSSGGSLTTTIGLQLNWTLYSGGRNKSLAEAARYTVLAVRQGLLNFEQQVLLDHLIYFQSLSILKLKKCFEV